MNHLDSIKKQYAKFSDQELLSFYEKNKKDLIFEAKQALNTELIKRGFLENRRIEESGNSEQSNFSEYWDYAINKHQYKIDHEKIYNDLLKMGCEEKKAKRIIKKLPPINELNTEFEEFLRKKISAANFSAMFLKFLIYAVPIVCISYALLTGVYIIILIGVAWPLIISSRGTNSNGALKGSSYWIDLISLNSTNIVWVMPIVEKTKLYFVVTINEEKKFQFLTNDNLHVTFTCNTDEDRAILFRGITQFLPDAHIGYSPDTANLYSEDPERFFVNMVRTGQYYPISRLSFT